MIPRNASSLGVTACIPRESGDDPEAQQAATLALSIPRESGDDPFSIGFDSWSAQYSPRERG